MLVLSAGMKKSGSTWVFQMINELLVETGHEDAFQTLWYLPRPAKLGRPYNVQLLLASLPNLFKKTYAIKTHTPPLGLIRRMVASGAMKAVYTYRDPRDAALSLVDFGEKLRKDESRLVLPRAAGVYTVEEAIRAMRPEVEIWAAWKEFNLVWMVSYEAVSADPVKELGEIAVYLGLEVSESTLSAIVSRFNIQSMTAKEQHSVKYNKAKTQRFVEEMTADQLAFSEQVLSPYLSQMGYSTRSE